MEQLIDIGLKALATWRISHMLVNETGPWNIFVVLREAFDIEHDEDGVVVAFPPGNVLTCVWCLSVWVAIVLLVLPQWVSAVFALSALAILVEERIDGKS